MMMNNNSNNNNNSNRRINQLFCCFFFLTFTTTITSSFTTVPTIIINHQKSKQTVVVPVQQLQSTLKDNHDDTTTSTRIPSSSSSSSSKDVSIKTTRRDYLQHFTTSFLLANTVGLLGLTTTPTMSEAATEVVVVENTNTGNLPKVGGRIVYGSDTIMSLKEHGTSNQPVQEQLLYGVSNKLADRICNYNRHFAEMGGYFESTSFIDTLLTNSKNNNNEPILFYDSVTGKPLFMAPIGRTVTEFIKESEIHGWPSFRDSEVIWENVRVLKNSGETVSIDGTHLGHNLPDRNGNRYCINLVSIAGQPI